MSRPSVFVRSHLIKTPTSKSVRQIHFCLFVCLLQYRGIWSDKVTQNEISWWFCVSEKKIFQHNLPTMVTTSIINDILTANIRKHHRKVVWLELEVFTEDPRPKDPGLYFKWSAGSGSSPNLYFGSQVCLTLFHEFTLTSNLIANSKHILACCPGGGLRARNMARTQRTPPSLIWDKID